MLPTKNAQRDAMITDGHMLTRANPMDIDHSNIT